MTIEAYKKKYKEDRFFQEVFGSEIYSPVLDVKSDIVLDVGALAGEFSIWMKDRAKKIYAFEPEKDQYDELLFNTQDFPNIYTFELALGDRNGDAKITPAHDRRGGFHVIDEEGGERVKMQTLATFMRQNKIEQVDVLKIDIEGGEQGVFFSPDFEEVAKKINFIIGEHLDGNICDKLVKLGFKMTKYQHGIYLQR